MFPSIPKAFFLLGIILHTPSGRCEDTTIVRDVAIIGGGSAGTYAAVRLRDEGKSVIVIEKSDILGGHTNTYQDPVTNQTVDYGVVVFHNNQLVKDYFDRLNVSWVVAVPDFSTSAPHWLDVDTTKTINYSSPDPSAAFAAYAQQLSKYPQLEAGFFLPDPVPQDLLLPFAQFLAKYPTIANATYSIFTYGQGLGDFLQLPTLYVFKGVGISVVSDIAGGFLLTTSQNNYEIYDHATQLLGQVEQTQSRDNKSIELIIRTANGRQTVRVNKLLITIPQNLENMEVFILDKRESSLFGEFKNAAYYTSLVSNTGLPAGFSSSSVSENTAYHLPKLPGIYSISATAIDGVFDIKYGSPRSIPDVDVQKEIISYIKKLQANGFPTTVEGNPNFVEFKSHAPFELTVSSDSIAAGFYKDLYALQGHRNTWYSGATFQSHDSSLIWNFTESVVLPQLLK
ncbi:hypothetical protein N7495_007801 [Penicillium taxi]|uniref:uncharacterized protein n=1 Tax=Penicillium taxi TaxID=168475 RepID=UPI00254514E0|nr:uncharacterized protein N7495_007801 [Penicillium taxi]KAJ5887760.1 hypothetical protein N7495_007801 [Penicillium taxi]